MCTEDEYIDRVISHKLSVEAGMGRVVHELENRGAAHDNDKLGKDMIAAFSKKYEEFNKTAFGSEESIEMRKELKPFLDVHYSINPHHPEFYDNGINGMTLLDLIEMLVDWKSASSAYGDNFKSSLLVTKERFKIGEQLFEILVNTAKHLNYMEE